MSESELAQAKAEIEGLKTLLREEQTRNAELIRANVDCSNRRENEIQKEIKGYCIRWRETKDLMTRLADVLENKHPLTKNDLLLTREARIAVKDVEPEQSSDWAGWLLTDSELLFEGLSQLRIWVEDKLREANSEDASVWAAKKARIEALETRLQEELL
jgi:hypothetical protein